MKKNIKTTAIVILSLLLLLLGTQWWLGYKIKHTIRQEIGRQSKGSVQIDIARVRVNLLNRSVFLGDIRIFTDTLHSPPADSPILTVDAYIREISVRGLHFNTKDSLLSLRARKFTFDLPHLFLITRKTKPDRKRPGTQEGRSIRLALQETDIRLGNTHYELYNGPDSLYYDLHAFSCRITKWQTEFQPDTFPPVCECQTLDVQFATFRNLFAEKSQLFEISNLHIQGKEKRIFIDSIRFIPQYPEKTFAQKSRNHTDWTHITGGPFLCYGVDFGKFTKQHFLQIDSAEIKNVYIRSFKNRQISQPERIKPLFYQSVQQFPFPVSAGPIRFSNINVRYSELSENGIYPGTITFNHLNGHFNGLSNIPDPRQPDYTLEAKGELLHRGFLQAAFTFPKNRLNSHFEVKGRLDSMPLNALNVMTEPLVKIKITSGQVKTLDFYIRGNDKEAEVNLLFIYNNLKIRIIKEKNGHWETRSFLTNLANGILIHNNNPDYRNEPRKIVADAERDPYRSQFNYLWRTLLAGLKKSIGL